MAGQNRQANPARTTHGSNGLSQQVMTNNPGQNVKRVGSQSFIGPGPVPGPRNVSFQQGGNPIINNLAKTTGNQLGVQNTQPRRATYNNGMNDNTRGGISNSNVNAKMVRSTYV